MKSAVCLIVLVAVVAVHGHGIPIRWCPPGEHSVLYCPQMAEPSCDNPTVHEMTPPSGLCDKPQCFCDVPNVRHTKTGKCVKLSKC
uniref:Protease inhibitor-like protein n=1 Tax=Antheraea mylitta TaxID=34739 RepID=Q0Q011_ANTMY|nr:protease inhibitor-like protein [Antheraea mylitta]